MLARLAHLNLIQLTPHVWIFSLLNSFPNRFTSLHHHCHHLCYHPHSLSMLFNNRRPAGLTTCSLDPFQSISPTLSICILKCKSNYFTPPFKAFNWLLIALRIKSSSVEMVCKVLCDLAPAHLPSLPMESLYSTHANFCFSLCCIVV